MSRKRKTAKSRAITKAREGKRPPGSRVTLSRSLLRSVPALIVLIFLTILLSRFGTLHNLEAVLLDVQLRLRPPPERSEVAIVNITDDDYKNIFGGRRPLDAQRLQELIDAIASGGPRVIGVDIDTSPEQYKEFKLKDSWPPLVWEREVKEVPEAVEANERLDLLGVLGRDDPALNANSGVPLLIEDGDDKVTRRYRRFLENTENEQEPIPSFVSAILRHSRQGLHSEGAPYKDRFIHYAGDREGSHRLKLAAARVLEQSKSWTKDQSPLSNKIVLLGGTYLDQDRHETPLGAMAGVDILASVLETELQGGGDYVPPKYIFYLLEILCGFTLVILFHAIRFSRALLLSLVVVPLLALVCSLISYGSFSGWPFFAPLLLGVVVYESFVEYRNSWLVRTYQQVRGDAHDEISNRRA